MSWSLVVFLAVTIQIRLEAGEQDRGASAVAKPSARVLATEVRSKGWIAFSARSEAGNWELFVMRPDGSSRRQLTQSPEFNEAAPRFSPDGKQMLFYRLPRSEAVDNNTYGTFDLVIARADATQPLVYGRGFAWASWGPDGRQIACLAKEGIQLVDVATRKIVRQFPRQGFVQQLIWSPDGRCFVGTANGLGQYWNIGVLDPATHALRAVSETDRYNCTPDWCPDSRRVVYARGIVPEHPGRAELWVARVDGSERRRIYAEPDRHLYGACASPDGRYILFTRSREDLGRALSTEMAIIRWPEPSSVTDSKPADMPTPVRIDLGPGWEPHWTPFEVSSAK